MKIYLTTLIYSDNARKIAIYNLIQSAVKYKRIRLHFDSKGEWISISELTDISDMPLYIGSQKSSISLQDIWSICPSAVREFRHALRIPFYKPLPTSWADIDQPAAVDFLQATGLYKLYVNH